MWVAPWPRIPQGTGYIADAKKTRGYKADAKKTQETWNVRAGSRQAGKLAGRQDRQAYGAATCVIERIQWLPQAGQARLHLGGSQRSLQHQESTTAAAAATQWMR